MQRRDVLKGGAVLGMGGALMTASGLTAGDESSLRAPRKAGEDLTFSAEEYKRRYHEVRKAMERDGIQALVVVGTQEWSGGDMSNIHYLGAPVHPAEHSFVIVPLEGKPVSPYAEFGFPTMPPMPPGMRPPWIKSPSSVEFSFQKVPVRELSLNSPDYAAGTVEILKELGLEKGRVGFVSMKNVPADVYAAIAESLPDVQIVDAQHILLDLRLYKSEEEIAFMMRSGYIADRGIEAMMNTARAGVSDYEVFYAIDRACAEAGAPVGGFHLYGSGPWGGPPGSTSNLIIEPGSARTIRHGDMLIPEVTSNYKGYFTQLTVPASIGEPSPSFLKAYEMCKKVHAETRKQFRAGATVREIDAHTAAFTTDLTDGEYTTLFGIQAGEHEYSLWHLDYELRPGAMAYNQPYFMPLKRPGGPFHVFGDAMVLTADSQLTLHESSMNLVVI